MVIAMEVQRLFRTKKHGMEIVSLEIIKQLQQTDLKNKYFIFSKDDKDSNCIKPSTNFNIIKIFSKII